MLTPKFAGPNANNVHPPQSPPPPLRRQSSLHHNLPLRRPGLDDQRQRRQNRRVQLHYRDERIKRLGPDLADDPSHQLRHGSPRARSDQPARHRPLRPFVQRSHLEPRNRNPPQQSPGDVPQLCDNSSGHECPGEEFLECMGPVRCYPRSILGPCGSRGNGLCVFRNDASGTRHQRRQQFAARRSRLDGYLPSLAYDRARPGSLCGPGPSAGSVEDHCFRDVFPHFPRILYGLPHADLRLHGCRLLGCEKR